MEPTVSDEARLPLPLVLNPSKGETPTDRLCSAIEIGDKELFKSLLLENSSLYRESLDSRGYSPIHVAILCRRHDMIETLLRERVGYGLRSKNFGKEGWTAYHFAAMYLDIDTLKMLKSSGYNFDPNERTELGSSPLHFVNGRNNLRDSKSQSQQQEVIKFFIDHGCDPLLQNEYGNTVVHESILWNDNSGLELMLSEHGGCLHFFKALTIKNKGSLLPHHLMQIKEVPYPLRKTICILLSKMERPPMKDQLQQKHMRLTDGTYAALSLSSGCRALPATISNPPHMLTREDICTIFGNTLPAEVLLNALIQGGHILKYSTRSKEVRYMYPQCLPDTLCCDPVAHPWPLRTICGRLLTLQTSSVALTTVYKLMCCVVTKWEDLPAFAASQNGFYFEIGDVQCAVSYVESRKPLAVYGIEVIVCSLNASINDFSFSEQLLTFCVSAAQRIQHASTGEDIQIGVMSSLDLMKGNRKSAHIYSSAEVSHAQSEGQQLLHPDCATPESFASLLLSSPIRCKGGHVPEKATANVRMDEKGDDSLLRAGELDGMGPLLPQADVDCAKIPVQQTAGVPQAEVEHLVPQLHLKTFSEEDCRKAVVSCYTTLTSQLDSKLMIEYLVEHHHLTMRDAHMVNQASSPYDKMVALLSMLEERELCKALLEALEHMASVRKEYLSQLSLVLQNLRNTRDASQLYSDSGVSSCLHDDDDDIVGNLSKESSGILQNDGCQVEDTGHGGHDGGCKIWGQGAHGHIASHMFGGQRTAAGHTTGGQGTFETVVHQRAGDHPWRDGHNGGCTLQATSRRVTPRAMHSPMKPACEHTTGTPTNACLEGSCNDEEFEHIEVPLTGGDHVLPHIAEIGGLVSKIRRLLGLANAPSGGEMDIDVKTTK